MKLIHSFYLLIIVFVCVLSSCQSSEDIDADFLNGSDLLYANFTDSIKVNATLIRSEPINLGAAQSNSVFLLGALDDPIFGPSSASMCMQFTLGTGQNNLNFDSLPQLDSVVLSLAYSTGSFYGDTDKEQTFNVFEITDSLTFSDLDGEAVEYLTDNFCETGQQVGASSLKFSRDSVFTDSGTSMPLETINIRLDDDFGQKFLDADAIEEDSTFFNIVTFLDFFKGLAVVPDENNTAIAPFNLLDSDTELKFYYKAYLTNSDTLSKRQKSFLVRAQTGTNNVLALNEFKHDYTGTAPQAILDNEGKITDQIYLQSMAGLEVELDISEIFDIGDLIVNKAELEINNVLEATNPDSLLFPQPSVVGFQLVDSNGDDLYDGGGQVIVTNDTIGTEVYRMNRYNIPLTLSIQRLVQEGRGNSTLKLKILDSPLNPFRLTANGPEAELFPMKLNLFYTEIE